VKQGRVIWASFAGIVGVVVLGASFVILPAPPAVNAPVGELVGYANRHHDLLLWTAWLEAAGSILFVVFLVALAHMGSSRGPAKLLTVLCGAAVIAVGLLYSICLIAIAESSKVGGSQLRTAGVAYGMWAACEHAFLLAPPVLLPLGLALRGSSALPTRFSITAVAFGCASIVLGLVGLFYAGPNATGAAGVAINALIGLESLWVLLAAASLCRRRPRSRAVGAVA